MNSKIFLLLLPLNPHIVSMKRIFLPLSLVAFCLGAQAQNEIKEKFNPVRTAVISQTIAADARGAAMGDVGAATEADVHSQNWNPAKYPFTISRAGFAMNYTPWLRQLTEGIALVNAVGYARLGDYQAVSGSIKYFTVGEVPTPQAGVVRPYEYAVDVAYSRLLSERFSAAVALRYMYSDLTGHYTDDVTLGSAFAADVAMYWNNYIFLGRRECALNLGLNVSNIGSKINFGSNYSYFIPTNLRFGANLLIPVDEYNKFAITAEANKLLVPSLPLQQNGESNEDYKQRVLSDYNDLSPISGIFKSFSDSERGFKGELEEVQWSVGAEYIYNDKFALRGGYHHESAAQGNRKYFTFGAGFKMNVLNIDAGYVVATTPSNPLDQTLRVTLSFEMDGLRELFGSRGR